MKTKSATITAVLLSFTMIQVACADEAKDLRTLTASTLKISDEIKVSDGARFIVKKIIKIEEDQEKLTIVRARRGAESLRVVKFGDTEESLFIAKRDIPGRDSLIITKNTTVIAPRRAKIEEESDYEQTVDALKTRLNKKNVHSSEQEKRIRDLVARAQPQVVQTNLLSSTPEYIRLLMFYSAEARLFAGIQYQMNGTQAIKGLIQIGVDETNQALETGGVNARIAMRASLEVPNPNPGQPGSWPENPAIFTNLLNLTNYDNFLGLTAKAYAKRAQSDIVGLVTRSGCGMGWPTMPDTPSALTTDQLINAAQHGRFVVGLGCIGSSYAFSHELGHTLGLVHHRQTHTDANGIAVTYLSPPEQIGSFLSYNFGFGVGPFIGDPGSSSVPFATFGDIMSYALNKAPEFSNPSHFPINPATQQPTQLGVPVGQNNSADAALALAQSVPVVAQFSEILATLP